MLKKKFFIHLFFSKESQYGILGEIPENSGSARLKNYRLLTSLIYS